MKRVPHQKLLQQSAPGDPAPDQQHHRQAQSAMHTSAAKFSKAATRKLVFSTVFWFSVLLYGFQPSRSVVLPTFSEPGRSQLECVGEDNLGGDAATGSSGLHLFSDLYLDAFLSQLESTSMQFTDASLLDTAELWEATPQRHLAAAVYHELASLVDLCPLLQAEPGNGTVSLLAYPHLCDGSQDRLPGAAKANDIQLGSLAKFTAACHSQQSCKSWWLQQQSQRGVCGCASILNLQAIPQHQQLAQRPGQSAWLPSLSHVLWLLIPLGRGLLLLHHTVARHPCVCQFAQLEACHSLHFLIIMSIVPSLPCAAVYGCQSCTCIGSHDGSYCMQ